MPRLTLVTRSFHPRENFGPGGLRLSTNPGDILDDGVSVPRGVAVKVLGVEGERLAGSEGEETQDLVLVDGPVFAARTAKAFLGNLRLLAKTTDRAEWAKKALSAVLRTAERALEAVGGESPTLKTMGGAPNVHPLGETYHGQTASRHGEHVATYSLAAHQPLGVMNRVRRNACALSAAFRSHANGRPVREPAAADLP